MNAVHERNVVPREMHEDLCYVVLAPVEPLGACSFKSLPEVVMFCNTYCCLSGVAGSGTKVSLSEVLDELF